MIRRLLLPAATVAALGAIAWTAWAVGAPVNDWHIAGPFGGTATAIAVDPEMPSLVLAGGMDSLLYRSRNSGGDWELMNFPRRNLSEISSILVDPVDSKHYLAGVISADGGGMLESHNSGETWTPVNDIRDFGVRSIAASASKPSRFVAGTLRGVMLSDDSGKTWTRISDPQNMEMQGITAVAVDPKAPNIIYAGTPHLPWKTLDGGKTWESIHTGMIDDSDVFSIYINPASPTEILASACSGIYASANRGDLWRKLMGIPNTSRRTHVIREDPSNASVIYAGTTTGLFKSANSGATWKTLTDTQVNAIAFDPSRPGSLYLAMEYDGIGKSADQGEAIDLVNKGFVDRAISSVSQSGTRLVAVEPQNGEGSALFASSDNGQSWSQLRNIRGLTGVHMRTITGMPGNDRTLLASTSNEMYKSIDSGLTWKPLPLKLMVTLPPPPAPKTRTSARRAPVRGRSTVRARAASPAKPRVVIRDVNPSEITALYARKMGAQDVIYAATSQGLLKSTDAGDRWTLVEIPGSPAVAALYFGSNPESALIAKTLAGLYISKDCGDHWSALSFPLLSADVNGIAIPDAANAPLLVATRVGLYSSPDWGATWQKNTTGMPPSTVSSVIYGGAPGSAFAVAYGQLYQSTDAGASWTLVPTSLPSLRIKQLWTMAGDSNRVFGITSDLGILFRD